MERFRLNERDPTADEAESVIQLCDLIWGVMRLFPPEVALAASVNCVARLAAEMNVEERELLRVVAYRLRLCLQDYE